jgi:hypothetical protein
LDIFAPQGIDLVGRPFAATSGERQMAARPAKIMLFRVLRVCQKRVDAPSRDIATKFVRTGDSSREEVMRIGVVCVAVGIMLSAGQSAWAAEPATVISTAIEKLGVPMAPVIS